MARYSPAVLDASDWIDASSAHPCPICYGIGGCSTLRDTGFARCEEQPSEWPLVVGGWLHRIEAHSRRPAFASSGSRAAVD